MEPGPRSGSLPPQDANNAQEESLRRLRRENHLLRRQILRMQDERRALNDELHGRGPPAPSTRDGAGPSSFRNGDHAPPDDNTGAHNFFHNLNASGTFGSEETEALRLRLKTLQRQNERERLRRQQMEREMRSEIEMLRLSLDQQAPGTPPRTTTKKCADAADSTAGLVRAATVGSLPIGPHHQTAVMCDGVSNESTGNPSLLVSPAQRHGPLYDGPNDADEAVTPLFFPAASTLDPVLAEDRRGGHSSSASSVASASTTGAAALLMPNHDVRTGTPPHQSDDGDGDKGQFVVTEPLVTTRAAGLPATVVPPTVPLAQATPEEVERMYLESVERYAQVSRGGRDTAGTFTGFNFPPATSSWPAPAIDPLQPSVGVQDTESLTPLRQQQMLNEADALMRKAADRRAMRKQRLEKFASTTSSPTNQTEGAGLLRTPEAVMAEEGDTPLGQMGNPGNSRLPSSQATTTDEDTDGGKRASALVASSAPTPVPTYNLANPNQIGVEIKESEKNRTWYLKQVLVQALMHAIHPASHATATAAALAARGGNGRAASSVSEAAAEGRESVGVSGATTPQPWMQSLVDPSSSSSSDSLNTSFARPGQANCSVDAAGPTGGAQPHPSHQTSHCTSENPSFLPGAHFADPSHASTPATQPAANAYVYKDINMIAMQRAIAECVSMHFRCRRNEPQITTNYREGQQVSGGGGGGAFAGGDRAHGSGAGTGSRLGAFADENTDPNLLEAFAPDQQRPTGASGNGGGGAAVKDAADPRGWDEDDDGLGPGNAFDILAPNNRPPTSTSRSGKHHVSHKGKSVTGAGGAGGDSNERYREDEVLVQFHAPVIFSQVRSFLRLDDNYLRASIEKAVWRQSASPGKSKTTLYYFADFVMKSMKESEVVFFNRQFLPYYVQYCERNPHTLLPRFYAVITVKWLKLNVKKVFLLMQNVFTTRYYIHRIYDVKGSTVGRSAFKQSTVRAADGTEETILTAPRTAFGALLLKDNDLPQQLVICGAYQRAILLAQFRSDVSFLSQLNIVDYSCMIGVRSRVFSAEQGPSKTIILRRRRAPAHYRSHKDEKQGKTSPAKTTGRRRGNRYGAGGRDAEDDDDDGNADHGESYVAQSVADITSSGVIGVGIDANYGYEFGVTTHGGAASSHAASSAASWTVGGAAEEDDLFICLRGCDGGLLSLPIYAPGDDTTAREDVYYLGIIDVLQEYNSIKKLENFAKGFVNDRKQISVVPPKDYAERLYKVLERITT